MATMKDVAVLANVALGTVSRYFNGQNVGADKKERIEQAVQTLAYKPNALARSMKTNKTMTIAVVVPKLSNIFSMRIIEKLENEAQKSGYSVIVFSSRESVEEEKKKIAFAKSKQVDGMILMPIQAQDTEEKESLKSLLNDLPVVLIDRQMDNENFPSVTVNNEEISYQATLKLLQNNVQKIGIVSASKDIYTAKERLKGFQRACKEKGVEEKDVVYHFGTYDNQTGYEGMKKLRHLGVDSVFLTNYEITMGALTYLREKKVLIGADISLVGFDNQELADMVAGHFYVVEQPIEKIGKYAAKLLIDLMKNREIDNEHLELQAKIIQK